MLRSKLLSQSSCCRAIILSVCLLAFGLDSEVYSGDLSAGFARVEITPPVGFRIAGNYYESYSKGVDDPLHGRVMYLADDDTRAFVISLDVCSIGRTASDPIRARIMKETGVPRDQIIVSATHNHAGPEYYGTLRDLLHAKALEKHGGTDPAEPIDYVPFLCDQLATTTKQAIANAVPVTAAIGETRAEGLAFNRRFHMKDGSVRFNPGIRNPNIVREAGPVDTRLPVLRLDRLSDRSSIGLYTTFALHTATYGDLTRFGADFPGEMDRLLREKHGEEFVALFGEGTAGDINHIDVRAETRADKWNHYKRIANKLVTEIQDLAPDMETVSNPDLKFGRTVVPIPLQELDPALHAKAESILFAPKGQASFLERVAAWKQLNTERLRERDGDHLQVELQALTIGDSYAIVSLPHEVFVEIGMQIRDGSPFPITAVISLAQDLDFYVPTRKAFAEGSYEVTTSSIKPGGGEAMAEAAVQLLQSLK
ncbi:MAG: hypothetical protein AAGG44_07650 [Planctomycetota bacterium]